MSRIFELELNSERKSEIVEEDLIDDESDFFEPEDNGEEGSYEDEYDDEPQEREYCD